MSPELSNEAEIMARHFQNTYKAVSAKRGKIVKAYVLLSKEEKQLLVDTFIIILDAASRSDDPLAPAHGRM